MLRRMIVLTEGAMVFSLLCGSAALMHLAAHRAERRRLSTDRPGPLSSATGF